MLDWFKNHQHTTKITDTNTALQSFIVYKDCYQVFWDQWQDSGLIQKKFLEHIEVPTIPDLPDTCKRFHHDDLPKVANYIQQLTGESFYPQITVQLKYKKQDVLPDLRDSIKKIFTEYNEKIGIKYND